MNGPEPHEEAPGLATGWELADRAAKFYPHVCLSRLPSHG